RFGRLIPALQIFLDDCFVPVCKPINDTLTLIFLDDADVANDESYHQITLSGMPLAKVFVKSTLACGGKVSVTFRPYQPIREALAPDTLRHSYPKSCACRGRATLRECPLHSRRREAGLRHGAANCARPCA